MVGKSAGDEEKLAAGFEFAPEYAGFAGVEVLRDDCG